MNMNVSLTEEQEEFVKSRISTGQYSSASEVVSEALRLMERHELTEATKLKWLQEAYAVGIASGDLHQYGDRCGLASRRYLDHRSPRLRRPVPDELAGARARPRRGDRVFYGDGCRDQLGDPQSGDGGTGDEHRVLLAALSLGPLVSHIANVWSRHVLQVLSRLPLAPSNGGAVPVTTRSLGVGVGRLGHHRSLGRRLWAHRASSLSMVPSA